MAGVQSATMIDKNKTERGFSVIFATMLSIVAVVTIQKAYPQVSGVLLGLIFIAAWTGLYLGLVWLFVDHPAELEAKYPITPEDEKRRREEFYDSLDRH